jgi:3-hydroxyacyl-CoA dehydrogenase/enoyl-CoA hydratase/3-hydroxybutyryl-CoA epimerase
MQPARFTPEEPVPPAARANPTLEIDSDGIAWITFDDPERPLNVLTEAVMVRFSEVLSEAATAGLDGRFTVVVVRSGKPGSFIAGADIDAISAIENPLEAESKIKLGQAIYNDLESMPVPTVAAIDGVCVGGGLELALACSHRVVSDASRTMLQLPEVMLGILPAWGGTSRLPRLIGLRESLDMLLTGRRADARKARRLGLADEVLPAELFGAKTREFALRVAGRPLRGGPDKRTFLSRVLDGNAPSRNVILTAARRKVMAETGGHYPAPLRILEILRATLGKNLAAGLEREAHAAAELMVSPVSKSLVHVFRMREDARKRTDFGGAPAGPREVKRLGVLGAGVMGGGIGQLAAYNDIRVYLKDIRHEAVSGGLRHARSLFDSAVKRRRLSRRAADQHMELIGGGLDYHGLAAADVVVEAVVERMDIKRSVLRETEQHVPPACVIATNTSSLSVDGMAEALERPDRFCGMHFFNPVHRMPLVEVVRGAATSPEALATVYALALRLGKVPVVVGDGPGFVVNRILGPYLNEAGFLLGDGAPIRQIDGVAKRFGMPMGPLRLIDEVGIDVTRHAGEALHRGLGDRLAPSPALIAIGNTDRLGRKGGSGFYVYENGREKEVDETVYELLGSVVPEPGEVGDRRIRVRLISLMVNEAAYLLEEGVVSTAAAVDLAMIMGTGFPPFRGGLLRFADSVHPRMLLRTLRELHRDHGDRFAPAPVVLDLAAKDGRFYEAFPGGPA